MALNDWVSTPSSSRLVTATRCAEVALGHRARALARIASGADSRSESRKASDERREQREQQRQRQGHARRGA